MAFEASELAVPAVQIENPDVEITRWEGTLPQLFSPLAQDLSLCLEEYAHA